MTVPTLSTVTRTSGANQALKDGSVTPRLAELDFVELPVLVHGFRRMVRDLEFDVSEMALTTYLCARDHGVEFTAIPAFLVRGFHHGAIVTRADAGLTPKDLEGELVGVNRGYTVTTGVWARGILQAEHGVDLSKVTWVLSGDEHVAEYQPPENVVPAPEGRDLAEMVVAGELAAAVGVKADHPDLAPLIPDPEEAAVAALRDHGLYPINHLVVVRNDVLAAHPGLAADLFEAFASAKEAYVQRLRADAIAEPDAADRTYRRVVEVTGDDPLPYGLDPNRQTLEGLIDHAVDQRILTTRPHLEELFVPETLELVR